VADPLSVLMEEATRCRACPRLVEWRERVAAEKVARYRDWDYWARPVPGRRDPDARVLLAGLAPAAHGGNRTGRVFTGDRSGDFLFAALHRCGYANQPTSEHRDDGLALTDLWVTAPVKCAPPANKPTPEERDRCTTLWLRPELGLLDGVRVVVALGKFAWDVYCAHVGVRPKPTFGHGAEAVLPDGATLLGSYHVSQQNTFTGVLTPDMLDAVLLRARQISATTSPAP